MQTQNHYRLRLAQERRAEDIKAADDARLLSAVSQTTPRQPLRRAIGNRIIAIGTRLAEEQTLEPARTR
ncbi:MAG TPA: hypothetical protein VK656_04250 [Candidatus Acidoferrum sp.]|nr:hypothetical protein [Candidatus Acidoferrum sp.]